MKHRHWVRSIVLLGPVFATGSALAVWKCASVLDAAATSANGPAPMESVTAAVATMRAHLPSTTSIGTVFTLFVVPVFYSLIARGFGRKPSVPSPRSKGRRS